MLPHGSGVIVNISSIFGRTRNMKRAAYAAAMHSLDGLAADRARRGIRACPVDLAHVLTPLVETRWRRGDLDP